MFGKLGVLNVVQKYGVFCVQWGYQEVIPGEWRSFCMAMCQGNEHTHPSWAGSRMSTCAAFLEGNWILCIKSL